MVKSKIMPPQGDKPTLPGGGTVFYVTEGHHRYLSNRVEREEGGTPNLIADVKLGLVLHLHSSVGASWIEEEELRLSAKIHERLSSIDRVVVLGRRNNRGRHLPIFSFLIRFGDRFLHYKFVCALLNDLFGIQSRGGCSCAGPMSQDILGLSSDMNQAFELALLDKHEVLRPGYTRISFPYWTSEDEVNFVIEAVRFVAEHGWCFLPVYKYNPKTGEWAHLTRMTKFPERLWLSNFKIDEDSSKNRYFAARMTCKFEDIIHEAGLLLHEAKQNKELVYRLSQDGSHDDSDAPVRKDLRWFAILGDVNKFTAKELSNLSGPLNPDSWLRNTEATAAKALTEESTAYARQRAAHKLAARSSAERTERVPRYMEVTMKLGSPQTNITLSKNATVLQSSTASSQDKELALSAEYRSASSPKTESNEPALLMIPDLALHTGTIHIDHEKPADGKLLPGQGATFAANESARVKPVVPPKKMMKLVGQAVKEWGMIQDGDRLLLGLSGGKDSLALLHILIALQKRAPVKFDIACCTVDPQTPSFDPSPLIPYVKSLGITYHYMSEPIIELAKTKMQGDSLCAFCARFKRGLLYSTCRTHGYNKLVLAQHLDDLAESFYMYII